MSDIRSYIDDLFRYIDTYENKYSEFQVEAFLQTYNGIYAVFQTLRQNRDEAVRVDQYFLEKVRQSPLSSSDMRQLTLHLLVSFFESEADVDGRSNEAYSFCRGLRSVKQDIPFIENHLVDLLFHEGGLNNNFRLNTFFLGEMVRFIRKFGKSLQAGLSPEAFDRLRDPLKMLELARRKLELGGNLLKDRATLEFHLKQVDAFEKLKLRGRIIETYLKDWDYLVTSSFWSTVKSFLGVQWGKVKGAFRSWRYFKLVTTQRSPAYVFYGAIMALAIIMAIMVPRWWQSYEETQLQEFKERVRQVQIGGR
ncbi:MAG: hypothetical protein DRP45_02305 [Candidatus Zixiibacteriota bacterium]|nr:MAG: hypothetical protein DRP45_02305 [candidate division Zixibacteria bacterium]